MKDSNGSLKSQPSTTSSKDNLSQPGSSVDPRPLATSKKPLPKLTSEVKKKEAEGDKLKIMECRKKIKENMKRMESCRIMQEKEQVRITTLTNQLTSCVSDIEGHERSMELVQQQLTSLYKQLKVSSRGGEGLLYFRTSF